MHATRRGFLRATAALAAATVTRQAAGADADQLPVIDTHQHLWDLSKFKPPWLDGAPEVLRHSHATREYLEATRGLNVVKAVYMEVDVHPRQHVQEAKHVIQLCRSDDHPTVAAVISGRPNSAVFGDYIKRFRNSPFIKGVRQVLHVPSAQRGLCLEPEFVRSIRLLGELGMSFDLCMRPTELVDGLKLSQACPETRFIMDHCGNADPKAFLAKSLQGDDAPSHDETAWRRDIEKLAQQSNVVCKISGFVVRAPENWQAETLAPVINHCLDAFGPDRVMFGGDWPVCKISATYRQWVGALKEVIQNRSQLEQRKLLHDNAQRFYGV